MNPDVFMCVSGTVPGYFSVTSMRPVDSTACLSEAAALIVLLSDGARVALTAYVEADDAEEVERVRWVIDVTPDVRSACRAMLLEEQRVVLAEIGVAPKSRAA